MKVLAFDLSLVKTGYCVAVRDSLNDKVSFNSGIVEAPQLPKTPKIDDEMSRLDLIRRETLSLINGSDLIVFEGLAYGANDPSAQERAGLAYLLRYFLYKNDRRFLLVPPSQLKKFVCSHGFAKKEHMILEVYKRFNVQATDNNEADAIGLAAIGLAYLGLMPAENESQRDVISKIRKAHA